MIGEDAVSVYTQLLMKFIDLLVKIGEEHRHKAPKAPKIRQGKLSKSEFNKLMQKGTEFKFIPIPKERAEDVEKDVNGLGGSFFKADDPENENVLYAVPAHQLDMVQTAVKQVLTNIMKDHPDAIQVKDGVDRIDEKDMPLVSEVMRSYDIPMFSFKSEDGKYTNIVPTEYEGQYKKAMNRAMEFKAQIEDIDVRTFEMNGTFEYPDQIAKVITENEAETLFEALQAKGLGVKFAHYGDDTAILYPRWNKEKVEAVIDESRKTSGKVDAFDITINDNSISIDKSTLLREEDEREYFIRVPNTHGADHIRLERAETTEINGGKTLTTKLDPNRMYPIYDSHGDFVAEREGSELLQLFDVKHRGINKDTNVVEYGNRVDKIDIYDRDQNKLISVGIDNAERIKSELMEQGVSSRAAERLLARIDGMLAEKDDFTAYRSILNYTEEKPEVIYADVPNIGDYIAQSQLSELVVGKAQRVGDYPPEDGKCACIFDKNTNKYTVVSPENRSEILARLNTMGYSPTLAEHIADKVVTGVDPQDIEEHIECFDSKNAELENMRYIINNDSSIIIHDSGEDVRYMCIDRDSALEDIEHALFNGFGIEDKITAAVMLRELSEKGIIEPLPTQTIGCFEVKKLSSDIIEVISEKGITAEPAMMSIDKLDKDMLKSMGADDKTIRSLERSLERSAGEVGKPDTLTGLKKFAHDTKAKLTEGAEKAAEKAGQMIAGISDKISKGEKPVQGDER